MPRDGLRGVALVQEERAVIGVVDDAHVVVRGLALDERRRSDVDGDTRDGEGEEHDDEERSERHRDAPPATQRSFERGEDADDPEAQREATADAKGHLGPEQRYEDDATHEGPGEAAHRSERAEPTCGGADVCAIAGGVMDEHRAHRAEENDGHDEHREHDGEAEPEQREVSAQELLERRAHERTREARQDGEQDAGGGGRGEGAPQGARALRPTPTERRADGETDEHHADEHRPDERARTEGGREQPTGGHLGAHHGEAAGEGGEGEESFHGAGIRVKLMTQVVSLAGGWIGVPEEVGAGMIPLSEVEAASVSVEASSVVASPVAPSSRSRLPMRSAAGSSVPLLQTMRFVSDPRLMSWQVSFGRLELASKWKLNDVAAH